MREGHSVTFSRMTITDKVSFKSPHPFCLFHVNARSPNPTKTKQTLIHVTEWGVTQRHDPNNVIQLPKPPSTSSCFCSTLGARKRWGYNDSRGPPCASLSEQWPGGQGARVRGRQMVSPNGLNRPWRGQRYRKRPWSMVGETLTPDVPATFPTWKQSLFTERLHSE